MTGNDHHNLILYAPVETLKESDRGTVTLVCFTPDGTLYVRKDYRDKALLPVLERVRTLSHPGIVGIAAIVEHDDGFTVIEEHLPGETLVRADRRTQRYLQLGCHHRRLGTGC
jgi:hypothetical protein